MKQGKKSSFIKDLFTSNEKILAEWIDEKAGVKLNGNRVEDISINNPREFWKGVFKGDLGLGEAYMKGYWDTKSIDKLVRKIATADLSDNIPINPKLILRALKERLLDFHFLTVLFKRRFTDQGSKTRAKEVGEKHYDLGNDLYETMLGKSMVYTCALWRKARDLTSAQIAKMDLLGEKLRLKPGMSVLDIGGGFGSLAIHLAKKYGVRVVNIGIAKQQLKKADELAAKANLPQVNGKPAVENRFLRYQDLKPNEKFDRVISVEMIEAVSSKYLAYFMKKVAGVLKDGGLFVLQTIGLNIASRPSESWITTYIFPNGRLHSLRELVRSVEGLFTIDHLENIQDSYVPTLKAWAKNFDDNWKILKYKYGDKTKPEYKGKFYRMWKLYLLGCAGMFEAKKMQLWQIVLSKGA